MSNWDPLLVELIRTAVHDPERARRLARRHPQALGLRTTLGETALHYLAVENYAAAVQLLIDLGASVRVTNNFGRSAIEEARMAEAHEAVAVLEQAEAACDGRQKATDP
jgi:ankyrin repeat protein